MEYSIWRFILDKLYEQVTEAKRNRELGKRSD
jgi:hypothetical protein